MLFDGVKFGMALQLAVGPICLYIFQVAVERGFLAALPGVAGTTLVDAACIVLAVVGVGAAIEKSARIKSVVKNVGAVILVLFGAAFISGSLGLPLLPGALFSAKGGGVFLSTVLIASSNPLTIVFWAGVFSAKVAQSDMGRKELYLFSAGCLLATVLFLTLVSLIGGLTGGFIPERVIAVLNIVVGAALVVFGIRTLRKC